MAWIFLIIAIIFEVITTSFLPSTKGFTKLIPTVGVIIGYILTFTFVAQATKTLEIGLVYAIWSGVGTAAIAAIGVVFLGESLTLPKIIGILLIILGVVMLNMSAISK